MIKPASDRYSHLCYPSIVGKVLIGSELQEYIISRNGRTDELFSASVPLKEDKARDILIGSLPSGSKILCKVHKETGFISRLKCVLGYSRAKRGHAKTKQLIQLGYNTPATLGFIVRGKLDRKCESIHFIQFMGAAQTLENLFESSDKNIVDDAEILTQLAIVFSRLHRDGFIHGDAKLSNLMLLDNTIYLIDLDGFKRVSSKWTPARDIARLLVGLSEQGCSRQQVASLVDNYCQVAGLSVESFKRQVRPIVEKFQAKHKKKYGIEPCSVL